MSQQIHSFAVSEGDKENKARVERLKARSKANGQSFTYMCLQGLKLYEESLKASKVDHGK